MKKSYIPTILILTVSMGGCSFHPDRLGFRAERHVDNFRATEDITRFVEYKQPF